MNKIETLEAPKAIGPYSQGVGLGNLIFVSGQLPIDPKTGKMVEGDIRALTAKVIQNIQAILEAAGSDLKHVVKTSVFMKDLSEFTSMNEEYGNYFNGPVLPARETFQVNRLPKESSIEISCIAVKIDAVKNSKL